MLLYGASSDQVFLGRTGPILHIYTYIGIIFGLTVQQSESLKTVEIKAKHLKIFSAHLGRHHGNISYKEKIPDASVDI